MKELSIEEKAKRYDEVVERAKEKYAMFKGMKQGDVLEDVFPELKEIEDDSIRKAIHIYLDWLDGRKDFAPKGEYSIRDMIAWIEKQGSEPNWYHHKVDFSACTEEYRKAYYDGWNNCNMQHSQCKLELDDVVKCLINGMKFYYEDNEEANWGTDKWSMPVKHIIEVLEKQCEKKPADKVEPKFKFGNWYQCTKDFFGKGVTFDKNTAYYCAKEGCLQDEYGCHIAIVKDLYDNFKLWTIQDAKDDDVLVCADDGYNSYILFGEKNIHCWYNGQTEHFHPTTSCKLRKDATIYPATKEQRDLLFQKMKEAGYEWDVNNKELKKIEQNPAGWSEEDERMFNSALWHIKNSCGNQGKSSGEFEVYNWLKTIKDRVQPKQGWREEDEEMYKEVLTNIIYAKNDLKVKECLGLSKRAMKAFNWFSKRYKSLRPQNWTKEDKERYISCLQRLGTGDPEQPETINSKWFKDHVYPQITWRPSDEQIGVIEAVINNRSFQRRHLDSLYEQLKKLREE